MNIHEETLKIARNLIKKDPSLTDWVISKFPELNESEDEKTRKELIEQVAYIVPNDDEVDSEGNVFPTYQKRIDKYRAWLEKQGEQKHADKVEPKFKVKYAGSEYNVFETKDIAGVTFYGIEDEPNHIDYVKAENCDIISGYAIKENGSPYPTKPAVFSEQKPADKIEPKFHEGDWVIGRATENEPRQIAEIKEEGYKTTYGGWIGFSFEEDMRLWTIKDAKEGDMLVHNGCTFIFMGIKNGIVMGFEENIMDDKNPVCFGEPDKDSDYCPATKKQRDILMKAMAGAGYTFDFEKKELSKIEQNSAWSEEDELQMQGIIDLLPGLTIRHNWLKSLKDRVGCEANCITTKEWSEEDEKKISDILAILRGGENCYYNSPTLIDFLKSLKDRYTWKPTEKQIKALEHFVRSVGESGHASPYDNDTKLIYSLLEQLKQL